MQDLLNVKIIPQLKDNYSYIVVNKNLHSAIIIDPSEAFPIINFIKENNLNIEAILITHHHNDHTSGINDIITFQKTEVFSPNSKINNTTRLVKDGEKVPSNFTNFKVLSTPGHTLDHVVYYDKQNKILFSGDTLFRFGCGRIFEGNYKQMHNSLEKIKRLSNYTNVYCGHEYTIHNLNFLSSIFKDFEPLGKIKDKILDQIKKFDSSMPFSLGEEKVLNPFLSLESIYFKDFMKNKDFNSLGMFQYLRDLRNNY